MTILPWSHDHGRVAPTLVLCNRTTVKGDLELEDTKRENLNGLLMVNFELADVAEWSFVLKNDLGEQTVMGYGAPTIQFHLDRSSSKGKWILKISSLIKRATRISEDAL